VVDQTLIRRVTTVYALDKINLTLITVSRFETGVRWIYKKVTGISGAILSRGECDRKRTECQPSCPPHSLPPSLAGKLKQPCAHPTRLRRRRQIYTASVRVLILSTKHIQLSFSSWAFRQFTTLFENLARNPWKVHISRGNRPSLHHVTYRTSGTRVDIYIYTIFSHQTIKPGAAPLNPLKAPLKCGLL
jgi:hypothetical protein